MLYSPSVFSDSPIRALLIDVGGPLVDESADFDHTIRMLRRILSDQLGRKVTESEIIRARDQAILAWAPSFTKAVLWKFLQPDKALTNDAYMKAVKEIYKYKEDLILMPGVTEILPILAEKYVLAIAGNQLSEIKGKLEKSGILKYFTSKLVSCDIGFHKPDSRFFTAVCDRIGIPPAECCMIGDRLDNDIYPANVMGMRTIWIRVGPHAVQKPRIPEDVPDAVISGMSEIPSILDSWEERACGPG